MTSRLAGDIRLADDAFGHGKGGGSGLFQELGPKLLSRTRKPTQPVLVVSTPG